jgi:hypothetical protein
LHGLTLPTLLRPVAARLALAALRRLLAVRSLEARSVAATEARFLAVFAARTETIAISPVSPLWPILL